MTTSFLTHGNLIRCLPNRHLLGLQPLARDPASSASTWTVTSQPLTLTEHDNLQRCLGMKSDVEFDGRSKKLYCKDPPRGTEKSRRRMSKPLPNLLSPLKGNFLFCQRIFQISQPFCARICQRVPSFAPVLFLPLRMRITL